ncbi:MAG TPA: hypothetical protein V6D05_08600 [Stenomitos sp.]
MTAPLPDVTGPILPPVRPPATWVAEHLSVLGAESVLCLYSGWGAEARALKRQGMTVTTADLLDSSVWWNRAFVADGVVPLSDRRLAKWSKLRKEPDVVKRFMPWANRYFTPEETIWLGIWYQHIHGSEATWAERAIGTVAVYWTIRYWLGWNREELGFKPLPPSAVFRRYVEQAHRMLGRMQGLKPRPHRAEKMAPEAALAAFPGELLVCYVPPLGGIEAQGLAQQLCEQWTGGDPAGKPTAFPTGTLGSAFGDSEAHLQAVSRLLSAADAYRLVALPYQGEMGDALAALVAERRPILSRQELQVPYPGADGSSIIIQGLLVAGAPAAGESGLWREPIGAEDEGTE